MQINTRILILRIFALYILSQSVFLMFKIPSLEQLLGITIAIVCILIINKRNYSIFPTLAAIIPIALGLLLPIRILNNYPSVSAFFIAFVWSSLFAVLLMFCIKKPEKDNRSDRDKKNK